MREFFRKFSHKTSEAVGSPWAFILATIIIVVWAVTGPLFGYSDTWQLVINTGTTIVTFLMVFLIQNTQNRDARAVHIKLDELIRGGKETRNDLVDVENMDDEELDRFDKEFKNIADSIAKTRATRGLDGDASDKEREKRIRKESAEIRAAELKRLKEESAKLQEEVEKKEKEQDKED